MTEVDHRYIPRVTRHRTGPGGRPWVVLERPKAPRVQDRYEYWLRPPPELSSACEYWVRQILRGWRPNRRIGSFGYDSAAGWYGVWIWEYLHVISPLLARLAKREDDQG